MVRLLDAAFLMRQIENKSMKKGTRLAAARFLALTPVAVATLFAFGAQIHVSAVSVGSKHTYLGFDRNIYPGDAALPILRKTFAFSSYWLSPPPGEKTNTWTGKRQLLHSHGFGFLVLYRGPDSRELKTLAMAKSRGARDGDDTVASAKAEGFPAGTIVFLDIEEGGRLPDTYHSYLAAWSEVLTHAGYHPGVYCSGMPVKEEPRVTITTADDIRNHSASRDIAVWAYNDACPPSPGCTFPHDPPSPAKSGIAYASVWQFAQSPRRKEFTSRCATTYHRDGNCYAPGDAARAWFLDVNSATSPDPSGGRN
jgi:glycoside hydrolase-like protein